MRTFKVWITRSLTETAEVEVQAKSKTGAEAKAFLIRTQKELKYLPDNRPADYRISDSEEIKEN